jgi:hypothetical protein
MMETKFKGGGLAPDVVAMVMVNSVVGAWVTLRLTTPYSLIGTWSDMITDAACGVIALGIVKIGIRWAQGERMRRLMRVSAVPGIVLGVLPLLIDLLLFVPPFTLGTMFYWSEVRAEQVIQTTPAPDGDWTAQVSFRPVGPYTGGSGRTFVKVIPRWLPFLEWELYYNRRSYADVDTMDYAQWLDSERLYIPEARQVLHLTWWGVETEAAP